MKPCAFFSRKFSPAERNYDVGNQELLAMKWAFEEWRHWLEGAKHRVVVLTDHKNLTYLESAKRLNPRQARWSLFFARFDFVISYLPGSKNVKADALSRSFVPDSPGLSEPAGILKEGVIVSAISPDLRRVLQKFQANKPDRCPAEKLFVPDRWTNKLISELKFIAMSLTRRMLLSIYSAFPAMYAAVHLLCLSCNVCLCELHIIPTWYAAVHLLCLSCNVCLCELHIIPTWYALLTHCFLSIRISLPLLLACIPEWPSTPPPLYDLA
ncbi:unnamed protein product [Ranitomeya imitator]|uniref:Reverse transcriptase RNase H-like domain-containing protein n=1 Tax=Ranitomeya imitator TaxID=111125 RepID=A0ABN9KQS7_9NEOB|nr:unnamed protein product [Ranitomeya imitator]